jgi:hypothetical protein
MSCISSGEGILVILSARPEGATVRMYGIFGIVGHNTRVPADMPERATRSLAQRRPVALSLSMMLAERASK